MAHNSYEIRLEVILSYIAECCGEIPSNQMVCKKCQERISKCSRLLVRSQISMLHYVEMVRTALAENRENTNYGNC